MSYPHDFTYDLALERSYKDERQKNFRKSKVLRAKTASTFRRTAISLRGVFDEFDGTLLIKKDGTQEYELLTLDVLYNLKQKNKVAELNAYTEAFIDKTQRDGLTPLFITTTVSPEYNIVKSEIEDMEICLKKSEKQYEIFDRFWTAVLTDRLFRNPETATTLSDSYKDWYYIPAEKRPYLKSSELTSFKSWSEHLYNIHQHTAFFIPNDKKALKEVLALLERKKHLSGLGRMDIRLDPKFKPILEKECGLTYFGKNKDGKPLYFFNRSQADIDAKNSGNFIVISFFDKNEDTKKQVVGYILKYVLKSVNAHTSDISPEDKQNDFSYRSKAVFSKLGRRPFSYSRGYTFKMSEYRKLRPKAVRSDPKFARLAYWTELWDKGLLSVKRFYGDRENEKRITRLELWLTSYVDGVPIEELISDWDADQYDTVETIDAEYFLFVSPTLQDRLKEMSA
jgi:hypothetical protein